MGRTDHFCVQLKKYRRNFTKNARKQLLFCGIYDKIKNALQRCLSGLRSTIGNRVTANTRPEVRILFSAP